MARERSQRFWSIVLNSYHATVPVLKTVVMEILKAIPIVIFVAIKILDAAIQILDVTKTSTRTRFRSRSPFDRRGGPFRYPY